MTASAAWDILQSKDGATEWREPSVLQSSILMQNNTPITSDNSTIQLSFLVACLLKYPPPGRLLYIVSPLVREREFFAIGLILLRHLTFPCRSAYGRPLRRAQASNE